MISNPTAHLLHKPLQIAQSSPNLFPPITVHSSKDHFDSTKSQSFDLLILCNQSCHPAAVKAPSKAKADPSKSKKPAAAASAAGAKKPKAYPTYQEMIKEAIVALKERTGSSQIAIAKFIEEVKNSFKLPPKSSATDAAAIKKAAPAKPKPKAETKPKSTPVKRKVVAKPKKAAKTEVVKSPAKKAVVAAKKKTPVKKVVKKPKSIKSPVKKAVKKAAK
ncbi:HISTONE H1.1 [Salix koriyanagi]|uniref:HISTONE H1.1 n=1 Tax=Salix koriyanagi TaxID=2511006 RepID=A0A9Q0WSI6_9ROSI|nr:HISTONE H1.1 [Salix koriyanagi]